MNKLLLTLILVVTVVVMVGGFSFITKQRFRPTSTTIADDKEVTPEGIKAVITANNQTAFDLYSEIRKNGSNTFFSPYSISTALAMVYEGARGQTAEEIQIAFHLPLDGGLRRSAFAAIHNQLNKSDSKYQLSSANALWAQNDYKFLDDYISILERYYASKVANTDFIKATEAARDAINSWAEENTNQKIKNLFPPGTLSNLTRLVLANAVYFKGQWVLQFDKTKTQDEDFRVSPTDIIKVPMMRLRGKDVKFNYAETESLQILEMPYEGNALSMLILLPKTDDLAALENSLSLSNLTEWKSRLKEQQVDVYLPKFTFNSKYTLNEVLAKMGMPTAFSDRADFSGMDGSRSLFIQIVIHQAYVVVNEEGTEAVAVTGVGVGITSLPPPVPVFRADHPFMFVIQDRRSENILFLGRVINPSV